MIARACFPLYPRQRILFFRFGMLKYREVFADLTVAVVQQFFRRRAHNAPVSFLVRNAKLFVANSTTNEVDLHGAIVPDNRC